MQIRINATRKQLQSYIVCLIFAILTLILIAIVQTNYRRLRRFAIHYILPETQLRRFVRQYGQWAISRRPVIDYDRYIGNGRLSNVYCGRQTSNFYLKKTKKIVVKQAAQLVTDNDVISEVINLFSI